MHLVQAILLLPFPVMLAAAAALDVATYRIPNALSLALAATFAPVALSGAVGGAGAVGVHLMVGVIALVLGVALFAARWIGGGDAKLIAAAALWLGWPGCAVFLLAMSLAGGLLAAVLLTLRRSPLARLAQGGPAWAARLARPGGHVPFGVAIALGAAAAAPVAFSL